MYLDFPNFAAFALKQVCYIASYFRAFLQVGGVGKFITIENPKSDLDLDLGFVKIL